MRYADLHIHTTASDGVLTPEEVLKWAYKKGLKAISITDHDTISGMTKALSINRFIDLEIVPGIELNSEYLDEEIHVLGYYINYDNKSLLAKLKEIQQFRHDRAIKMIKNLKDLNMDISIDEVKKISKGESIGRPHIAQALINKGYSKDIKSAFRDYIGAGCPAYADRYKLSTKQAIIMINDAGGIPVLAHPGLLKNKSKLNDILNQGFSGIEVYHSKHDNETVKSLKEIAGKKELIITGGSDCHGKLYNNEPILGTVTINYNEFFLLKQFAQKKEKMKY